MEAIYHYTVGAKLEAILSSGKLVVSPWEKSQKIKNPALWLSLNPIWEPTAAKSVRLPNGDVKYLKMEEHTREMVGGLYRFVLPFKKETLCSWAKYRHATDINPVLYVGMEKAGISQGANPKDWYASFEDISLNDVTKLELWDNGQWSEALVDNILETIK